MYVSTDGYHYWRDRKNGVVFATPRLPSEPEIWLTFYEEVSLFSHAGSELVFASPRPVDDIVREDWRANGVEEIDWNVYQQRLELGWATCDKWDSPQVQGVGARERFYLARQNFLKLKFEI